MASHSFLQKEQVTSFWTPTCINTTVVANIVCTSLIWNHLSFTSWSLCIFLKVVLQLISLFNLASHLSQQFRLLRLSHSRDLHLSVHTWRALVNSVRPFFSTISPVLRIWFLTACTHTHTHARTHARTHTHTRTLSLSLSHTHTLKNKIKKSNSHPYSLSLCCWGRPRTLIFSTTKLKPNSPHIIMSYVLWPKR